MNDKPVKDKEFTGEDHSDKFFIAGIVLLFIVPPVGIVLILMGFYGVIKWRDAPTTRKGYECQYCGWTGEAGEPEYHFTKPASCPRCHEHNLEPIQLEIKNEGYT